MTDKRGSIPFMLTIRKARVDAGMTIDALAEASEVSPRTIIRIEQNPDYEPGVLASHRIAQALGVPLDDLLHTPQGTETVPGDSEINHDPGTAATRRRGTR